MSKKQKSDIELFVIAKAKAKRLSYGMSQAELAHRLNVSNGFVGQVESPEFPAKYNLNHLNQLAEIFNCSLKDFFPDHHLS